MTGEIGMFHENSGQFIFSIWYNTSSFYDPSVQGLPRGFHFHLFSPSEQSDRCLKIHLGQSQDTTRTWKFRGNLVRRFFFSNLDTLTRLKKQKPDSGNTALNSSWRTCTVIKLVTHMKTLFKTLRIRKNPKCRFKNERIILLWPLALPFKAGDIRAYANHARELEIINSRIEL